MRGSESRRKMAKKIFITFLISVVFFGSLPVYSQEAFLLGPLIDEAKKNNPDILAAKKNWDSSLARVPQAKSLDNPTVGVKFEKIPRGTLKFDKTMPDDRMLSVEQMFPLFGKLPLKGKIAVAESQMAAAEYKNKELEVIAEVKNAYYDLFMNYKESELNEQSLNLLESIINTARAKYSIGLVTQEELFKLNLEIARLSNEIQNLKEARQAKETRLNTMLDRNPEAALGIPQLDETIDFSVDTETFYRMTIENKPELLVFSYAIERNKFAKSLAERGFFPDMAAGIVQRGIASGGFGPWDLMMSFTVPLWFWSKQKYEIKEAVANLEGALAAYQAMKNKALAETKGLIANIEIAKNKINLYKTNMIPILESSISVSLAGFASGKSDFMMLLDNQRMLVETKMEYYKALVEYNMNLADLERQVGLE